MDDECDNDNVHVEEFATSHLFRKTSNYPIGVPNMSNLMFFVALRFIS